MAYFISLYFIDKLFEEGELKFWNIALLFLQTLDGSTSNVRDIVTLVLRRNLADRMCEANSLWEITSSFYQEGRL